MVQIISKEVEPLRVKMGAMKTFRELLYEEEGIATNEEKKEPEDSESEDSLESYEMKEDFNTMDCNRFKRAMERTQKFKLVEIEQEEDNEIYDSEEEIEIIVEDKRGS
ncbi:unnamed protein product [Rhizophagus irregularis]|nr:unnamed protein product [Rhizophagus irregularis]